MRELNRRHYVAAATASFIALVLIWLSFFRSSSPPPIKPIVTKPDPELHQEKWEFRVDRDARNLGLSDEQCDVSYESSR